jgi:hypothetical protein
MPENTVTATARAYFRGQEGEGEEGMVKPGDVLKLSRQRAADLKANGLIDVKDPEPAKAADQAAAPAAPAKVEPITTATVTKPAEAKK